MRAAVFAFALATAACGVDRFCTTVSIYGIRVDVTGPNDQPIDATVTLRDGDSVEVIEPFERINSQYLGAGERAGTYDVTVEAAGFRSVMVQDVRVEEDDCHVQPEQLVVALEPL
ncbi:MAG: carboxypeptidase-like regulatory domain-containing protein [Kofleriaceae bacterium]